jgi:imidazolonepropionase-like amidohydrolase
LADLMVVDGNPLESIAVLQDHQRIKLVFKEGQLCVDRRVSPALLPLPQPVVQA